MEKEMRLIGLVFVFIGTFGASSLTFSAGSDIYYACALTKGKVIPGSVTINEYPNCPDGQLIVSWSDGEIPVPQSCPTGEAMTGFDANGVIICAPSSSFAPQVAYLVDANGATVGGSGFAAVAGHNHIVYFQVDDELYYSYFTWKFDKFDSGAIYYDSASCEGKPYILDASYLGADSLHGERDGILYGHEDQLMPSIKLLSWWNSVRGCTEISRVSDAWAAVPFVDLSAHPRPYKLRLLPTKQ